MPQPSPAVHIFKPGLHISDAGEGILFSEADLAATARAYNPKLHEAPLVIGHPKADDPAQGWVKDLTARERGLFAGVRDVEVAFSEGVRKRRFPKVSAKFYRPTDPNNPVPGVWYLRHVGFLGAQPPGVKGLDDPAFAEGAGDGCVSFQEAVDVQFGDWDDRANASLWRRLREWFISKYGTEEADQVLPSWNVDQLQESAAQPEAAPAFAEGTVQGGAQSALELEAELNRLRAEIAQRDSAAQAAARDAAMAHKHADHVQFAEGLVGNRQLAPVHREQVVAWLDLAATPGVDGAEVQFGEGEARAPLINSMKSFLSTLPQAVEFSECATKDRCGATQGVAPAENPLLADAKARHAKA